MRDSEIERRKRELHLQIGRLRRRINNRLHAAEQEGRRLASWREYMNRFPGYALLAAFGAGLAISGKFWRGPVLRRFGPPLLRHAARRAGQHLWRQICDSLAHSGAKP